MKRITKRRTTVVRKTGKPRLGWKDDVREDLGQMKSQNWSKMATDREAW